MASLNKLRLLLTVLVASAAATTYATSEGEIPLPPRKTSVWMHITNSLYDNHSLRVHCTKEGDDYRIHDLAPGETYTFDFPVKGTTYMQCEFIFNSASHWFDVYDNVRDGYNCAQEDEGCVWSIYQTSPCLKINNDPVRNRRCFPWKG